MGTTVALLDGTQETGCERRQLSLTNKSQSSRQGSRAVGWTTAPPLFFLGNTPQSLPAALPCSQGLCPRVLYPSGLRGLGFSVVDQGLHFQHWPGMERSLVLSTSKSLGVSSWVLGLFNCPFIVSKAADGDEVSRQASEGQGTFSLPQVHCLLALEEKMGRA